MKEARIPRADVMRHSALGPAALAKWLRPHVVAAGMDPDAPLWHREDDLNDELVITQKDDE